MDFVFLHGGPKFSGTADRVLFGPHLQARGHDAVFWSEPSRNRASRDPFEPDRAYERWLRSAETFALDAGHGRLCVMAHSFTVHAAMEIARRHPRRVERVVAIAPAADPFAAFSAVLRIAQRDFADTGDPRATVVGEHLRATAEFMDKDMLSAFALAAGDSRLFDSYWREKAQQERAAAATSGEPKVDVDSFVAVLTDYRDRQHLLHRAEPVSQPVLALFGEFDPVSPEAVQVRALRLMSSTVRRATIIGTGHFPHLEAPESVIDTIEAWLAD